MSDSEDSTPLDGSERDSAQASDLCTRCGLCCMGAIHDRAVLEQNEMEPARIIGLPVLENSDRPVFSLPCPKLSGTACTIFGHRPRVCSRYQCQLLHDYQDAKVTFPAAEAKIAYAHSLLQAVRERLPSGISVPEARALVNPTATLKVEMPMRGLMELRLRATALELYLDRNFRAPKDGRALEMKEIGQS